MTPHRTAAARRWRRAWRLALGAALWLLGSAAVIELLRGSGGGSGLRGLAQARDWVFGQRLAVRVAFDFPVELMVGDPVFLRDARGRLTPIGELRELLDGDRVLPVRAGWVREARLHLAPADPAAIDASSRVISIAVPQTAAWVVRTLLPPERVAWVAREWNATLLAHREKVFEAISPLLRQMVADLERILLEDIPPALERRRGSLAGVLERLHESTVERELLPLLEDELFPVLYRRAQPTLDAIGSEIFARLPVWSLTWRWVYESLPLTEDGQVERLWRRFVDEEILPILKRHVDDALGAVRDVIAESARNPRLAAAFQKSLRAVLHDRELQHQLRLVFQETILDNPRFQDAMWELWRSPQLAEAIEKLSVFVGPLLSRVGEAVLGSRGGGITPEFARVLRTQILEKDRRWFLIESGPGQGPGGILQPDHLFRAEVAPDG